MISRKEDEISICEPTLPLFDSVPFFSVPGKTIRGKRSSCSSIGIIEEEEIEFDGEDRKGEGGKKME